MKLVIFMITAYLASRMCGPDVERMIARFETASRSSTPQQDYSASVQTQFCLAIQQPPPVDPVVIKVAGWLSAGKDAYRAALAGRVQLLKLLFAALVVLVPHIPFKLAVATLLVMGKWVELGLDLEYALEILLLLAAIIAAILRSTK